jgi:hypothetical protein
VNLKKNYPAGIVCNTVTANQSIFLMLYVKLIKFFKYSFLTNLYPTFYVGVFRGGGVFAFTT